METKKCYKCGKVKIAIKNKGDSDEVKTQMVKMTWGINRGRYYCLNCKGE